jgi:hypothetical protein
MCLVQCLIQYRLALLLCLIQYRLALLLEPAALDHVNGIHWCVIIVIRGSAMLSWCASCHLDSTSSILCCDLINL